MSKLLAFAFWQLRRFFAAVSNDGLADWKAMVIIGCWEIAAVMMIFFGLSIAIGRKLFGGADTLLYLFMLIGLLLACSNLYVFRYKKTWTRFEAEFKGYSVSTRTIGAVGIILAIVAVAAGVMVSATFAGHLPK